MRMNKQDGAHYEYAGLATRFALVCLSCAEDNLRSTRRIDRSPHHQELERKAKLLQRELLDLTVKLSQAAHCDSAATSPHRMERTKFFCNERCSGCEATENRQAALLMNVLREVYGDGVVQIANSVCPNMTYCPDCRIDDFRHMGDDDGRGICEIEAEARRVARRFKQRALKMEMK